MTSPSVNLLASWASDFQSLIASRTRDFQILLASRASGFQILLYWPEGLIIRVLLASRSG